MNLDIIPRAKNAMQKTLT